MPDDFLIRAALAGAGVTVAAAPLGCFVAWRRMAYFGDATAHAALLGLALSVSFSISIFAGVLAVCLAMALAVSTLSERGYRIDTFLGGLAHSALAVGLVAVSLPSGVRVDLSTCLFGDILAVTRADLAVIWGGALAVLMLIPAAAARPFSGSPEAMALTAGGIGAASALAGLCAPFQLDTPTGPSIVCAAARVFLASTLISLTRRA
ncbi:metal ABC transporter permease [Rhodophyticola porphyridii]|uniref:High-affinity zinc uptake system membrane protein ZnuB n=1 Tax=Rhodophyticola porphyridii TaxID=1852017 RepID=A0A3L9Y4H6_9RHOB|nr:metal ABC transporter permease [Rhodophyticola porphyridii]RMA41036.1 hypothetical protein D9R08_16235 [Rhodophyticola porphyridii]